MAKREAKVSEDKLQALVDNWNAKDVSELAQMLGTGVSTINYWAGKLRKAMRSNGMTDEQIRRILPAKRKQQGNVYDIVVKRMLPTEQAPGEGAENRREKRPRNSLYIFCRRRSCAESQACGRLRRKRSNRWIC